MTEQGQARRTSAKRPDLEVPSASQTRGTSGSS